MAGVKTSKRLLCYDIVFKAVFQEQTNILAKMISDITGIDYNLLKDNIILETNELPINRKNEKAKKCDFIIRASKNKVLNLEINRNSYAGQVVKNLAYLCDLFSTFTKKGEKYDENLTVMQINIDCFENSSQKKPLSRYYLREEESNEIYVDNLAIYSLNIVKCNKIYYNEAKERIPEYIRWGAFLYNDDFSKIPLITKGILNDKERKIIMDKLNKITKEDYFMTEEEALEWADWTEKSIYDDGRKQEQQEMIKSMFENKADLEFISKVTGKSIEEIKNILEK